MSSIPSRKPGPRPYDHPAYSFTDASGQVISVPGAHETPATRYTNEPMSRDTAMDIVIAFGVATESEIPIVLRRKGQGWNVEIPAEFLWSLARVREVLERRDRA